MFVTTKTHTAAIREKDEVIEGLMKRLDAMSSAFDRASDENFELHTRLAPFERQRGKGGRFVKKGVE